MKIHLVTHTPEPLKAIAIPFLNMGIGRDIKSFDDITQEEARDALKEIFKSHLDAPTEFATFNLFWEDIPIFMRAQLVRHRVGWGFAERSLRFYDANIRDPIKDYDFDSMPTIKSAKGKQTVLKDQNLEEVVEKEMERQMMLYSLLLKEGIDQQDARNIIGVWYPTAMQTTCSYRALRTMLSDRLSSQAHPFWQSAAKQIKKLITEVDKDLGDGLIDSCEMYGRCVWKSKYDRDCDSCIKRGTEKAHEHIFDRETSFGENTQCSCGTMKQNLLK
jgi:flavin-dependent thymidylate synthase|tara:strand:- start:1812 stop:2633 length:822 start_codon:yes stop_codon:yes gene_type:complete